MLLIVSSLQPTVPDAKSNDSVKHVFKEFF